MKLYSKEVLLLGGIYEILAIPLAYIPSEVANIVTDILFGIFIICIIMLFFNKIPKFITFVQNSFPKISYYLTAIGWIPYAIMFFFIIFIGSDFVVHYTDEQIDILMYGFQYGTLPLYLISLIVAFFRYKTTKAEI